MRLILKTLLSYHWRNLGQSLFLLAGLVSGLSLWVAVQVINDTANASYQDANQLLDYQLSHLITSNSEQGVPLAAYVSLRRAGFDNLVPVLERRLRSEEGELLDIVATDLFAIGTSASDYSGAASGVKGGPAEVSPKDEFSGEAWLEFVSPPYLTYVPADLAQRLGITDGDSIITRGGVNFPSSQIIAGGAGNATKLMLDIGAAMAIFEQDGFDYLAVIGNTTDVQLLSDQLEDGNYSSLQISSNTQALDLSQLTDSFHINLTAMSLLSLVVGLFIIYNAAQFSIIYRRGSIRTLRACGVSVRELAVGLIIEYLLWVLIGTLLGCALGFWLGSSLLPNISATLNGLYGASVATGAIFNPQWLWQTMAIGLVGMGLAIAVPMWNLMSTPAIIQSFSASVATHDLDYNKGRWFSVLMIVFLVLLGCGLLEYGLLESGLLKTNQGLLSAFGSLAALLFAGALILPQALSWLIHLVSRGLPESWYMRRWLMSDIMLQLPRTRIAFMAILLALVANIGVNLMVSSFRTAFTNWLDYRLAADIYVVGAQDEDFFNIDLPGVTEVFQTAHQTLRWQGKTISVRGIDPQDPSYNDPELFSRLLAESINTSATSGLLQQWQSGTGVFINEQMRHRQGVIPGNEVVLTMPDGSQSYRVLGTVHDYGNTQFEIYLPSSELHQNWPSAAVTGVGLVLDGSRSEAQVIEHLVRVGVSAERIRSQADVKRLASTIFERTFLITAALNSLTLLIAGISMLCALLALQIERAGFIGNLLSLGLRRTELITGMLGALLFKYIVTLLLALPLGYLLAWVLIEKINILSFGWTMPLVWQGQAVLNTVGIALLVLLASSFPVLWLLKRKPLRHWLARSVYSV
ncbi:MAG: ABC transporter permease [Proteobacteria bacterium]|jgi:putative ABC transport system permease protein|nr:ABC transporter permease [Pseudomonadota bacterium]